MKYVIFEDLEEDIEQICEILRKYYDEKATLITQNSQKMLNYINQNQDATLYFLDLVIKDRPKGLELAKELIGNSKALIVFMTAYPKLILGETYLQVKSFNLIDKSSKNIPYQICKTIDLAKEHFQQQCFVIRKRKEDIYIPYHDILWIESVKMSDKIIIHSNFGVFEYRHTLIKCQETLDHRFIQLRKTHIINRDKIRRMDFTTQIITLENGHTCPFSHYYAYKNGFRK